MCLLLVTVDILRRPIPLSVGRLDISITTELLSVSSSQLTLPRSSIQITGLDGRAALGRHLLQDPALHHGEKRNGHGLPHVLTGLIPVEVGERLGSGVRP